MNAKKIAAGAVLAVALPVVVDVAADPYADRGPVRSWCRGAVTLAAAVIMRWALSQFEEREQ